jgi:hypothetical protein
VADDASDAPPRILGQFSDYNELITALRARAAELNLSGQECDRLSGLPDRYAQKLLGPQQIRRLGVTSLGPFLGALAVRCLIVEDKAALERLRRRTTPRNGSYARPAQTYVIVTDRKWARIQKLGQAARRAIWDKLPPQQRSDMMRALTLKRWRRLSKKQRSEIMRALVLKRWRGP